MEELARVLDETGSFLLSTELSLKFVQTAALERIGLMVQVAQCLEATFMVWYASICQFRLSIGNLCVVEFLPTIGCHKVAIV